MVERPLVSINIVVLNGEKYARFCLDSILSQTYPHELIEINIFDNGSTDETVKIIEEKGQLFMETGFYKFEVIKSDKNLGMWPGQEKLLETSAGKYIVTAAIDVILDKNFISRSVDLFEQDSKLGAIEAKIYKFDLNQGQPIKTNVIDTCGFEMYRSRRIVNIGHGQTDQGQFDQEVEIFAVEGACPILRREAIEDIRIDGKFIDDSYFWYGDDLDFAWRMTLCGWKQIFAPGVVAWHDRQTTKKLRSGWADFIKIRREIPMKKRRLDWRNMRFTIIKNDYIINILKDLPFILKREIFLLGYIAIHETPVLLEVFKLIVQLPRLIRQRKKIMAKAQISPQEFRKFIQ